MDQSMNKKLPIHNNNQHHNYSRRRFSIKLDKCDFNVQGQKVQHYNLKTSCCGVPAYQGMRPKTNQFSRGKSFNPNTN